MTEKQEDSSRKKTCENCGHNHLDYRFEIGGKLFVNDECPVTNCPCKKFKAKNHSLQWDKGLGSHNASPSPKMLSEDTPSVKKPVSSGSEGTFNLSKEIMTDTYWDIQGILKVKHVKEFIRRLKAEIIVENQKILMKKKTRNLFDMINKLCGEDLK